MIFLREEIEGMNNSFPMESDLVVWRPVFWVAHTYAHAFRSRGLYELDRKGFAKPDSTNEWGDMVHYWKELSRFVKAHLRVVLGYVGGKGKHGHAVVYSPDLSWAGYCKILNENTRSRLWKQGFLNIKPYKPELGDAPVVYTRSKHDHDEWLDSWVYCPCCRSSCRKGRCRFIEQAQ